MTAVAQFRSELRGWLAEHTPPAIETATTSEEAETMRAWQRTLHADHWVGIHWPVEHGGRGASPAQTAVYNEELARAGSPPLLGRVGVSLVGPTVMPHGTDDQRRRWLPRILNGDDVWCQLFSEPDAGSDLAGLTTRADEHDGVYVVNGQKVWSSYARFANWGIALVRTDRSTTNHRGISMLAIPMTAAGVEVRPLRQITGVYEFNEVFFDNVEVPAENRIGPEHEGWRVANTTLANERGASFIWREQVLHEIAMQHLIAACARRARGTDPIVRQRLARSWIEVEIFRLHNARTRARLARGDELGSESSLVKLLWANTSQRLYDTAPAVLGPDALLMPVDPAAIDDGRWALGVLAARANSIMGGTSEIQRNIIGERLLGLPPGSALTAGVDVSDLIDPQRYRAAGVSARRVDAVRAEAPVAYFAPEGWEPFWAITKHADVLEIAKQPLRFSSAEGITLLRAGVVIPPSEMVVMLDPPEHGPVRRIANGRFTPRAVREQAPDIERIATETLDDAMQETDTPLDFVDRIAAPFPLGVIAWILGVPADDWPHLFRWTNEVIGKDDPEYRRPGETAGQTIKRARGEVHAYFRQLIAQRRADPQDDLMSELVQGEIAGKTLTEAQLVSYCELLVEAGNETTRNAISGGLLALSEHPGEWERLRAQPDLLPDAVEEILRWASPISHFTRVAVADYELRGQTIRAGEQVALYFGSANRDEDVFDDPFAFRIDRRPNPHLAFGFGEHFCMGAHVARVEIETIFRHLLARMESFQVAGTVERLSSITNGSIKRLPIDFTPSSPHNGDDT